jgi:hypothetical protein
MAATGFTPISLYYSTTASAVPTTGNLANGELGLNINDMKLYAKNSSGVVTLLASSTGATGTVSSISVVSANGLAGTVATSTTTPAITLSTTITGVLKGNGTAISAAVSGTDYAPATSGTSILYGNGSGGFSNVTIGSGISFAAGTLSSTGSGGTVTSVAQSFTGGIISVAGSPITGAGTLALTVAGTSGGIPYFSSTSAWASSGLLTQYGILYGGGAGAAPSATAIGTAGQVLTSNGAGVAPTFQSASGGGGFSSKTANYTAVSGDNILANTNASSWTLTLPATPATGASVQVVDSAGSFDVYPLTVARNGSTIMSASEDMTLSVNGAATTFVYNGSTWRVI